jgi:hypothetical protein
MSTVDTDRIAVTLSSTRGGKRSGGGAGIEGKAGTDGIPPAFGTAARMSGKVVVAKEESIAEDAMDGEAEHVAVASVEELDGGAARATAGNPLSRSTPTTAREQITDDGEQFRFIPLPIAATTGDRSGC